MHCDLTMLLTTIEVSRRLTKREILSAQQCTYVPRTDGILEKHEVMKVRDTQRVSIHLRTA